MKNLTTWVARLMFWQQGKKQPFLLDFILSVFLDLTEHRLLIALGEAEPDAAHSLLLPCFINKVVQEPAGVTVPKSDLYLFLFRWVLWFSLHLTRLRSIVP